MATTTANSTETLGRVSYVTRSETTSPYQWSSRSFRNLRRQYRRNEIRSMVLSYPCIFTYLMCTDRPCRTGPREHNSGRDFIMLTKPPRHFKTLLLYESRPDYQRRRIPCGLWNFLDSAKLYGIIFLASIPPSKDAYFLVCGPRWKYLKLS